MYVVRYQVFSQKSVIFFSDFSSCQNWINEMKETSADNNFEVITIFEM